MEKIKTHILNTQTNTLLATPWLTRVPRVGDEVRLDEQHQLFKVLRVIWLLDEPEYKGGRVNLGVEPVEE